MSVMITLCCPTCKRVIPEMEMLSNLQPCCLSYALLVKEGKYSECSQCHHIVVEGQWPFCPHPLREGPSMIERDGIPGGMWLENGFKHPVKVYSMSEAHRLHAEAGVELKERFCPAPGTDIDPAGVMNPKGYMDPQTLKNGAELLCRQSGPKQKEWDGVEAGVLKDVQVGHITQRDAEAIATGDKRRQSRFHRRTS